MASTLLYLAATVGDCQGNTSESISQLVNAQGVPASVIRDGKGRVIAFLIQTHAAAAFAVEGNGFDSCARAQCQTRSLAL